MEIKKNIQFCNIDSSNSTKFKYIFYLFSPSYMYFNSRCSKPMVRCQNSCYKQKRPRLDLDCKTVGFFLSKSVKKSVKRGARVLRARSVQASPARAPAHSACEVREKKNVFLLSLPSLALCF